MKKNFKKFASLMLALVMAFALAAPAFAADYATVPVFGNNITVSLQLVDEDGNEIFSATNVSVSDTATAYDLVVKYFEDVEADEVDDTQGNCSVWNTYGSSMYLQTIKCNGTKYATVGLSDAPAGIVVEKWFDGYGRVSYDEDTGEYTYIYAGHAWVYDVDTNDADGQDVDELTMNQYVLHDGDEVVLTYDVQISDMWTTTEVLPGLGV